MGVAAACQPGAAPLDPSFRLADDHIRNAQPAFEAERHLVAATADHNLGIVSVAGSRLDPSGHPALRRQHVQERQPGMVDRAGGFDQLFRPGDRLMLVDQIAEQRRVGGDGGGDIQIAVVGGPPEGGSQVGQLDGEPPVGVSLSGAVPKGHDVGFPSGEVPRVGGPNLGRFAMATSCSSANWRIVSSIENRVRPEDRSATSSDLRTRASSRSRVAKSSSEPMTAQALSRSNPPANTEHRSSSAFSSSSSWS